MCLFHSRHRSKLTSLLLRPPRGGPAWHRLAEQLRDEGCDSIYLDRLRSTYRKSERLEDELAEEMARALSNTSAKVSYEFARLDMLLQKGEDCREQRERCKKARYELIVHRQALGFKTNNHAEVEKHFPLK